MSKFLPYQKVLVRNADSYAWRPKWFSHVAKYKNDTTLYEVTDGSKWKQCIAYEGNEHFTHTTKTPVQNAEFGTPVEGWDDGDRFHFVGIYLEWDEVNHVHHIIIPTAGKPSYQIKRVAFCCIRDENYHGVQATIIASDGIGITGTAK